MAKKKQVASSSEVLRNKTSETFKVSPNAGRSYPNDRRRKANGVELAPRSKRRG